MSELSLVEYWQQEKKIKKKRGLRSELKESTLDISLILKFSARKIYLQNIIANLGYFYSLT